MQAKTYLKLVLQLMEPIYAIWDLKNMDFSWKNESVNNKVRNSEFRNNRSGNSIGGDRKSQLIKM